jgi:ribosome biogenesis protein ERB1
MSKRRNEEQVEEEELLPPIQLSGSSSSEEEEEDEEYTKWEEERVRVWRKKRPEIVADYESDTSDEEPHNTIGNVPIEWYDDYPHIGYDRDGKKILRPAKGDELDKFLASMDDKDAWYGFSL